MIEVDFSFENDIFSYKSNKCYCGVDVTNLSPGVVENKLKIQKIPDQKIYFAFSGENGLCRTTETGSVHQENILNELLSLPNNDMDALIHFFEMNGFFFDVNASAFETINFEDIFEIVRRLRTTILLMEEVEAAEINYSRIVELSLCLLFCPQVVLNLSVSRTPYCTCRHFILREIENAFQIPEIDGRKEEFNKETYSIKDSIYGNYELNINEYNDVISANLDADQYPGYLDVRYRSLLYLYRNGIALPKNKKFLVDFLFHFMHRVGVVSGYSFDNGIEFYGGNIKTELPDEQLKNAAVIAAKIIINEEINYNLVGIVPRYSALQMGPTWRVPNLLSALYFSVFYLRPGTEIYRKCANPSCTNHFLVKTTNSRKIYCCPQCRNATAQRNHRKKVKRNK